MFHLIESSQTSYHRKDRELQKGEVPLPKIAKGEAQSCPQTGPTPKPRPFPLYHMAT